jgi:hypothetical protein
MSSIFLITDIRSSTDSYGRDDYEAIIDPDLGFFLTEESAQEYADSLMKDPLERHAEAMAEYERTVEEWRARSAEARELGFSNPKRCPSRPLYYGPCLGVIEVKSQES